MNQIPPLGVSCRDHGLMNPTSDPSFACIRCWKLKKKCDKTSPQCRRCTSAGIACVYSEQPPTARKVVIQYLTNSQASAAHSSLDNPHAMPTFPSQQNKAPRLEHAFQNESFPSPESDSTPGILCSDNRAVSRLAASIYTPFHAIRDEIGELFDLHMVTLNTWLPIIEEQIPPLSDKYGPTPDVEACTLLLSIYLLNKKPVEAANLDLLYSGLKSFHSNLSNISSQPIPIIQAGMLLAIYEQSQGLHQASYLTIGACVRMGQAIGLHKSLQINMNTAQSERAVLEQQRRIWWCLVILERLLALHSQDEVRPFTTAHPSLHDYLPSEPDDPVELGKSSDPYSKFPKIKFPSTGPVGSTLQAFYILKKVLEHAVDNNREEESRQADHFYLDQLLQNFMAQAIQSRTIPDGTRNPSTCASFFVLMFALLHLHKYNLTATHHLNDTVSQASYQRSVLALRMLVRVRAQSKANAALPNGTESTCFLSDINAPHFMLFFSRDMALVSLDIVKHNLVTDGSWGGVANTYADEFRALRRRWRLAGDYLSIISKEQAEKAVT